MAREAQRKGFTIIEVALVLAVSGLLLIGVISTTSGAIARQRYNDSVQSVTEHLRVLYTQVNNPQNPQAEAGSGGRTNQAIYGKFVVFKNDNGVSVIESQTIIGKAEVFNGGDSSFATTSDLTKADLSLQPNSTEEYRAPWEATIEKANSNPDNHDLYTGSLLILYSPNGGAIHTYVTSSSDFNEALKTSGATATINLCVNSPDLSAAGGVRRNIRLAKDGRNSSAVQLIDVNSEDNQCR